MAKVNKAAKSNTTEKAMKRKQTEWEKMPMTYAEDLGLKCKQFKAGTREVCNQSAEFYEPGLGDVCSDHRRSERAIRYSKKPQFVAA